MNWITLLTAGFCIVVAVLLSAEAALRAATLASIPDIVSFVSEAIPIWRLNDLDEHAIHRDLMDMTIEANKESRIILNQSHRELQREDGVLGFIGAISKAIADKSSGKAYGSDIPSLIPDFNELEERRGICQLMLNFLSVFNQTVYKSREDFSINSNIFRVDQRNRLNAMIDLSVLDGGAEEGEPVQATSAGDFFRLAINRVNMELSKAHGGLAPEHAPFVRALHLGAAAANMYDVTVGDSIYRFNELSETIKVERAWFEKDVKEWLESGCPTTTEGVQTVLEETVAMTDKWRSKLQELYSHWPV